MISERDAAILDQYADGATLEEIGVRFAITRERVRQIVVKHGGADAAEARRKRTETRSSDRQTARQALLLQHEDAFRSLAGEGHSRPAAIERVSTLFPSLDIELAEEALRDSGIVFDQEASENIFSDAVLEAGVWYLLGAELRLKPDPAWACVNLSSEIVAELPLALAEAAVSRDEIATILGIIGAAQKYALENPSTTITGNRYQELRTELLDAMGLASAKGTMPWPPTRQTIMKRFAGWNDALTAMGLATASKGRSKGLVVFTEADYLNAVTEFAADCDASGLTPTYASYHVWSLKMRDAGNRRPSPAAVRNLYGSWLSAMRMARGQMASTLA